MLNYYPLKVSSINMPFFRRKNHIHTASGNVVPCKRLYSTPVESRLSLLSTGVLYSRLQRATIPDVVCIQLVLLKMGMLMLEACGG